MSLFSMSLYQTVLAMECFVSITMNHILPYIRHPRLVTMMMFVHLQNLVLQMGFILFFCICHEYVLDWVASDLPFSYINHDPYLYTCNLPWNHHVNAWSIFVFGPFLNVYNLYTTWKGERHIFQTNVSILLLIVSQWYVIVMLGLPDFLGNVVVTLGDRMHTIPSNLDCNIA